MSNGLDPVAETAIRQLTETTNKPIKKTPTKRSTLIISGVSKVMCMFSDGGGDGKRWLRGTTSLSHVLLPVCFKLPSQVPIAQDEMALSLGYAASLEATMQEDSIMAGMSEYTEPTQLLETSYSAQRISQELDDTTRSDISERPSVEDVESETGSTGALETRSLKDHKGESKEGGRERLTQAVRYCFHEATSLEGKACQLLPVGKQDVAMDWLLVCSRRGPLLSSHFRFSGLHRADLFLYFVRTGLGVVRAGLLLWVNTDLCYEEHPSECSSQFVKYLASECCPVHIAYSLFHVVEVPTFSWSVSSCLAQCLLLCGQILSKERSRPESLVYFKHSKMHFPNCTRWGWNGVFFSLLDVGCWCLRGKKEVAPSAKLLANWIIFLSELVVWTLG